MMVGTMVPTYLEFGRLFQIRRTTIVQLHFSVKASRAILSYN